MQSINYKKYKTHTQNCQHPLYHGKQNKPTSPSTTLLIFGSLYVSLHYIFRHEPKLVHTKKTRIFESCRISFKTYQKPRPGPLSTARHIISATCRFSHNPCCKAPVPEIYRYRPFACALSASRDSRALLS